MQTWAWNAGPKKPLMLRALEFSVPKDKAIEFGRCKIQNHLG